MSQARILAIAFIVVGALLALVSVFADAVGLGAPGSTFGWKQLLGTVLGVIILVAGVILLRQPDQPYDDEEYEDEEVEEGEPDDDAEAVAETGAAERPAPGAEAVMGAETDATAMGRQRMTVDADELADDVTDADADPTHRRT
jgi:hypothetical protein